MVRWRTVPDELRIITELVTAPLPVNRTPLRKGPSVTPVAQKTTWPLARSVRP